MKKSLEELEAELQKLTEYDIDLNWLKEPYHTAAIIPLYARCNFGIYPVPEFMQPVRQKMTALQKCLIHAASLGVDSIWLICKPKMYRYIKKRIPDFVIDPVMTEASIKTSYKRVPIMIVPEQDRFIDLRDSPAWHLYYGSMTAYKACSNSSRWVAPNKFLYLSPYCMLDESELRNVELRKKIRSREHQTFSFNSKTYMDYELLPFTFRLEDLKVASQKIKKDLQEVSEVLNKSSYEYYTSKITIPNMFDNLDEYRRETIELSSYYRIDSWTGYIEYLTSDIARKHVLRSDSDMRYTKFKREPDWRFGDIFKEREAHFNEFLEMLTDINK